MISRRLIRIKILQILYSDSRQNDNRSIASIEKELFHSINKFYDLYLMLYLLLEEISKIQEQKIKIRQNSLSSDKKAIPNNKLTDNEVVKNISSSKQLHIYKEERKLNWKAYSDFLNQIYKEFTESDVYETYVNLERTSLSIDKQFAKDFFSVFLIENESFNEFLEDVSIYWNDDIDFAALIILKNIDFIKNSKDKIKLFPTFKNEDDKEYAKTLVRKTIKNFDEQLQIIQENTQNWDTDRIANIDLLILQIAVTELFEFSSIPVKVTMNEYIEIAKYYSTNKSNIFINGVLDRIIRKYEGKRIKKTGRGLVE